LISREYELHLLLRKGEIVAVKGLENYRPGILLENLD
jgi:hypothetical protein